MIEGIKPTFTGKLRASGEVPLFSKTFGHALYRTIIENTPWDTGALAHSVKIRANTPKKKKYTFVSREADHVQHLEEGTSSHGKHKHFIRNGIVPAMIKDIGTYYKYGGHWSSALHHDRRVFLSEEAKLRGYGKGKVTVGRSRTIKGVTRQTRKQTSLARNQ